MSNKYNQEDGEGERDVVDGVEPFWKNQSVFLTVHAQGPAKYWNKTFRVDLFLKTQIVFLTVHAQGQAKY